MTHQRRGSHGTALLPQSEVPPALDAGSEDPRESWPPVVRRDSSPPVSELHQSFPPFGASSDRAAAERHSSWPPPEVPLPGQPPASRLPSAPPSVPPESMDRRTLVRGNPSGVEIALVADKRSASPTARGWCLLTVDTQNRIYEIDTALRCIGVFDRASRSKLDQHPLLGAQLVGGKRREGETMHLSQPIPRPGMMAVFEQRTPTGASISESSTVTRVLLRLRQCTFGDGATPALPG